MTGVRSNHTSTTLADGKVLVTGGELSNGQLLKSSELYDPATGCLRPLQRRCPAKQAYGYSTRTEFFSWEGRVPTSMIPWPKPIHPRRDNDQPQKPCLSTAFKWHGSHHRWVCWQISRDLGRNLQSRNPDVHHSISHNGHSACQPRHDANG
jgi:hypothetical protein